MSDGALESHLAQILSQPNNMKFRVELADALKKEPIAEYQKRGKFIFLQLDTVRKRKIGDLTWLEDQEEAEKLESEYQHIWLEMDKVLGTPVGDSLITASYHRGMLEEVTLGALCFIKHGDNLFKIAPVRHLNLDGLKWYTDEVFSNENLLHIVSLNIRYNEISDRELYYLATSKYLKNLIWFDLSFNDITKDGVKVLAQHTKEFLPELKYVDLCANNVPSPVDEYRPDPLTSIITDTYRTKFGKQLEQWFGHIDWLHSPATYAYGFPPVRADL